MIINTWSTFKKDYVVTKVGENDMVRRIIVRKTSSRVQFMV